MAFLGIDLGTTGCKAVLFDEKGSPLFSVYREYDIISTAPGRAELDAVRVWEQVKEMVRECSGDTAGDIEALSVSSLGEASVPVTADRKILGNSILNYDNRGSEYLQELGSIISNEELYNVNGNPLGPNYALTKLLWYKREQPEIYKKADKFLLWSSFILFMMGADPVIDHALANRTLLLDIDRGDWNLPLIKKLGFDPEKLPAIAPAGSVCGRMTAPLAEELGLSAAPLLVTGTHDQCANAVGCGVLDKGTAMYGMGTFHCIVSVFRDRPQTAGMLSRGLNTESHAAPEKWVTFIYNQGGILLKWFRDTFAAGEEAGGKGEGSSIFTKLLDEMPAGPSPVSVLPHLTTTGPPDFLEKTSGIISGLTIDTNRGDICKGILEGVAFYLRENLDNLPAGMEIDAFTAVGGGSKSDLWMQMTADILDRPCRRTGEAEAGSLGAAILAAVGAGRYRDVFEAAENMVKYGRVFVPAADNQKYSNNYNRYKEIYPRFGDFLAGYKEN